MSHRPNAQRVAVVGVGVPAHSLVRSIAEDRDLPIVVVGCIDDGVAAKRVKILAGLELGMDWPEIPDSLLVSVTEMNRGDEVDRLAAAIAEVR